MTAFFFFLGFQLKPSLCLERTTPTCVYCL
jgi:hypothetical protein